MKRYLIPGTRFLIDTQDNGVPFDRTRLLVAQEAMQTDIDNAISTLYENDKIRRFEELNGKSFNPNSTVQLRSFYLTIWASNLLEKRLERAQILLMRKCSRNSQLRAMYHNSSWIYDKNLKSKILILIRSYLNWIEILTFVQALIFMVLLVAGSVLLVNLICNSCLEIILL